MKFDWKSFSLLFVLFLSVAFELVSEYKGWPKFTVGFPFSDYEITLQTYVYFLFEHFILVVLAFIIMQEERRFYEPVKAFFLIQVGHATDFILTYNETWFTLLTLPISINTVGFAIFAYLCYRYGRINSD